MTSTPISVSLLPGHRKGHPGPGSGRQSGRDSPGVCCVGKLIEKMHPGLKYITQPGAFTGFSGEIPAKGEWPEPDSPDREVRFLSRFWDAEGAFTDEHRAAMNASARKELG